MAKITLEWKSLQDVISSLTLNEKLPSEELNKKRPVLFLALRAEEYVVQAFSSHGLNHKRNNLYWHEISNDIEHYEYKYDENVLEKIAHNLLDSAKSTDKDKLNARFALSLIAFKHEIFADNPDPWKLAALVSGLSTVAPTPKQNLNLDSRYAQKVRGKKGGSRAKKNQALQEVIVCIVKMVVAEGEKPSASAVWRYLERFESYSTHNTGVENCEELFVDGDELFWTDKRGEARSIKKRSLDTYIAEAKERLSNSP
jgi:hypothetical protein